MLIGRGGHGLPFLWKGDFMARKSRYAGYYKATLGREKKVTQSTQKSILGRLKELKGQEMSEKKN